MHVRPHNTTTTPSVLPAWTAAQHALRVAWGLDRLDAEVAANPQRSADLEEPSIAAVKPRPVKPPTAHELAEHVARFRREVPVERARLAATDPAGEAEAIAPLSEFRARQTLLAAAEARDVATRNRMSRHTVVRRDNLESGRDLLTRLGADPARARGVIRCPAHEDRHASLSWCHAADGRALLHCFSGCTFADILAAAS